MYTEFISFRWRGEGTSTYTPKSNLVRSNDLANINLCCVAISDEPNTFHEIGVHAFQVFDVRCLVLDSEQGRHVANVPKCL